MNGVEGDCLLRKVTTCRCVQQAVTYKELWCFVLVTDSIAEAMETVGKSVELDQVLVAVKLVSPPLLGLIIREVGINNIASKTLACISVSLKCFKEYSSVHSIFVSRVTRFLSYSCRNFRHKFNRAIM